MGLCSATKAGAKGNIKRCIDPEYDCAANHQHRESSLQQISIRGPLHIIPVARDHLEKPIDKEPLTGDSDDDKGFATSSRRAVNVVSQIWTTNLDACLASMAIMPGMHSMSSVPGTPGISGM